MRIGKVQTTTVHPRRASANSGEVDLGTLLTLPFKIVIGIVKKILIGIPIMIAKSIIMAILMAMIPLIVVAVAIYWFFTTQI